LAERWPASGTVTIDAEAIAAWRAPQGMTAIVHTFDARVGGRFRISLTYESPTGKGKTTDHTDTHHGRFTELVSAPDNETGTEMALGKLAALVEIPPAGRPHG
jgi:uncharacterized protein YndB with AHSA1/START domain